MGDIDAFDSVWHFFELVSIFERFHEVVDDDGSFLHRIGDDVGFEKIFGELKEWLGEFTNPLFVFPPIRGILSVSDYYSFIFVLLYDSFAECSL